MPTNANTFNSRVTSEALEAKFRQVFPAQGGAELVQDLFASGVIQPVIDFSSVAEGSVLSQNLQTAWDFSTGHQQTNNTTHTIINNPGFWRIDVNLFFLSQGATNPEAKIELTDGLTAKDIWRINESTGTARAIGTSAVTSLVVFVRSGDSVTQTTTHPDIIINSVYRQIADVSGNLVNPLGFTFS